MWLPSTHITCLQGTYPDRPNNSMFQQQPRIHSGNKHTAHHNQIKNIKAWRKYHEVHEERLKRIIAPSIPRSLIARELRVKCPSNSWKESGFVCAMVAKPEKFCRFWGVSRWLNTSETYPCSGLETECHPMFSGILLYSKPMLFEMVWRFFGFWNANKTVWTMFEYLYRHFLRNRIRQYVHTAQIPINIPLLNIIESKCFLVVLGLPSLLQASQWIAIWKVKTIASASSTSFSNLAPSIKAFGTWRTHR